MRRTLCISFLLLLLRVSALPAAETPRDTAVRDLAAVERAFAQTAADKDWIVAFKTYFAEDGVWFVPAPEKTQVSLVKLPPEAAKVKVEWYPTLTDASSTGQLGFNLGPYVWSEADPTKPAKRGYFFTVWKRTASGAFRVAVDFGVNTGAAAPEGRGDWHAVARRSVASTRDRLFTLTTLADEDRAVADAMREAGGVGYSDRFDREAVLLRDGILPRRGPAIRKQLQSERDPLRLYVTDGAVDGDLGYTYGTVQKGASTSVAAYYVHVWRLDPKRTWRLAVDVLKPVPPQKAP
jgi:ketosteroid isomerase-like protein